MIKSKSYSISGSVRLQKSLTGIFSLSGKAVSKKVSSANLSSSESNCINEAYDYGKRVSDFKRQPAISHGGSMEAFAGRNSAVQDHG